MLFEIPPESNQVLVMKDLHYKYRVCGMNAVLSHCMWNKCGIPCSIQFYHKVVLAKKFQFFLSVAV